MTKKISKEIIKLAKKYSKTNNKKACKISWKIFRNILSDLVMIWIITKIKSVQVVGKKI